MEIGIELKDSAIIPEEWYNDLMNHGLTLYNPYFFEEDWNGRTVKQVQVDILDQEEFDMVSTELGWM